MMISKAKRAEVLPLFEAYHAYGDAPGQGSFYAVFEDGKPVAAFCFNIASPGTAQTVCKDAPYAVMSLQRMVALPPSERKLKRISEPLIELMTNVIDRGRYPCITTYADLSIAGPDGNPNHGAVYQYSGFKKGPKTFQPIWHDAQGRRKSSYAGGRKAQGLVKVGTAPLRRYDDWVCDPADAAEHVARHGWVHEPMPGKFWRSGKPACRWVNHSLTMA